MSAKIGTTVRFDPFDRDLIDTAAANAGLSTPEFIARAARAAALQAQLRADTADDGGLSGWYDAVDTTTAALWQEPE
ncbi:DUF1778 domain-containing protein [Glycomyces algeriensis]|uniref:Uncharacterized protein n=1 Tax=Glycomyces algeriensis TaxID=256037 RepID=A0A9W6GB46_9ACTN|nr:DUF1778 domain-containing protein [Glycomyces algeriensis]MDA1367398.1 DUF1778 domain-containing protein [Glycomyces algeriensis]MDR7350948.1 hypothetical protein [Glycomyces algeriensis]GLI43660.1 hypothetical protein GALLR39Z86_35100 [Glycomyces algeriensis]